AGFRVHGRSLGMAPPRSRAAATLGPGRLPIAYRFARRGQPRSPPRSAFTVRRKLTRQAMPTSAHITAPNTATPAAFFISGSAVSGHGWKNTGAMRAATIHAGTPMTAEPIRFTTSRHSETCFAMSFLWRRNVIRTRPRVFPARPPTRKSSVSRGMVSCTVFLTRTDAMHRHAPVLRPLALLGLACALAPAFGQQRPSPFAAQPAQQQSQSPFAARPAQPQREAASLIVPGEDHAALMRRLRVLRTYRIAELRANPRVRLGAGLEANLTPVLNNPSSTFNVAQKLRALPRQVEVRAEESTFDEVEQGLLVHGSLSYRILRGACRDAGTRAQLAAAGAPCFTAEPESSRIAAFATPRNPRYVADPARRARAVAEYREKLAASRARSAARVTALRQALSDPGKRAGAVARVGAAEVRRVAALGDEQLKQEAVESARVTIEETIYVPRIATLERTPGIGAMHIGSGKPSAPALKK